MEEEKTVSTAMEIAGDWATLQRQSCVLGGSSSSNSSTSSRGVAKALQQQLVCRTSRGVDSTALVSRVRVKRDVVVVVVGEGKSTLGREVKRGRGGEAR